MSDSGMPPSGYEFKAFKYSSHDSILKLLEAEREPVKILDRTHLRFFTLRSLHKTMEEGWCEIQDVIPTPLPLQIVLPITESNLFAPLHELLYLLTRGWKTLFACQFVIVATPNEPGIVPELDNEILDERIPSTT